MQEFFSFVGKDYTGEMTLSTTERIVPIVISISIIILLRLFNNQIKNVNHHLKKPLGIFLLVTWLSYFLWYIIHGEFGYQSLPISLCSLTSMGFIIALLTDKKIILDIVFYWGIVGGLLAMLFVGDVYRGTDHFRYYQFYFDHGLILILPFYYTFIENYKPTFKTSLLSYLTLFIAALLTLPVNLYYKMDYMVMNPYNAPSGTPAAIIANSVHHNLILYVLVLVAIGLFVYLLMFLGMKKLIKS